MKIKFFLEKGESPEKAEELLFKALNPNNQHSTEEFSDPAAQDLAVRLEDEHEKMYNKMLQEIFDYLDEIY